MLGVLARRAVRCSAACAAAAVLASACAAGDTAQATPDEVAEATVVATTTILGDIAAQVAGDGAEVVTLMPSGADPHAFAPSAQQVEQLTSATLVVRNGAGLEASVDDAIDEAQASGTPVFTAMDHVDALAADAHGHSDDDAHDDGDGHDHGDAGSVDPHFWMDPLQMADVAAALGEDLGAAGVDGARERASAVVSDLEALDAEIERLLAPIEPRSRRLVTNHDALEYLARRYDFDVVGLVIPSVSTGAEPSARDVAALAETMRATGVDAIFAETTQPLDLARALASEVGRDVEVVELYTGSLGDEGSGAETYADMLRTDAQRIADALVTG